MENEGTLGKYNEIKLINNRSRRKKIDPCQRHRTSFQQNHGRQLP